jgi:hypothetical protein
LALESPQPKGSNKRLWLTPKKIWPPRKIFSIDKRKAASRLLRSTRLEKDQPSIVYLKS